MSIAPPAVAPACGAQNLTKVFGEGGLRPVVAVNNVTLAIEAGSFTAIMGPSGSGKSTLMHCMAGLDRATSGSAWVGDQDLSRLPERQVTKIRRDKIGLIFQQFHLISYLTAVENIMVAQYYHSMPDEGEALEALEKVGLKDRARHLPSQLSGGEQQRVCIARALINSPDILLGDEPTGNLDEENEGIVIDILRTLHNEGATIIVVTHDPEVGDVAQRKIVLEYGKIAQDIDQTRPLDPKESGGRA